jgi:hypothetical protein
MDLEYIFVSLRSMKKFISSYFLPLCIFLLSGFTNLYAHSYMDTAHGTVVKMVKNHSPLRVETNQIRLTFSAQPVAPEREEIDTELEEDESENESVNCKKSIEGSKSLPTTFYAQAGDCFFVNKTQSLRFFSTIACDFLNKRYLIFQTFRI